MMTATLEIFTPHQPTSPAQPFDQDDREAIISHVMPSLIKTDQPCSLLYDQIHRRLMTLPKNVQKTNSWIQVDQANGSDRPGGIGVTEPPPARGARSNFLDICFQELQKRFLALWWISQFGQIVTFCMCGRQGIYEKQPNSLQFLQKFN